MDKPANLGLVISSEQNNDNLHLNAKVGFKNNIQTGLQFAVYIVEGRLKTSTELHE